MPDEYKPVWSDDPILEALELLIVNLWRDNLENARQATQTINRLLAVGTKVESKGNMRELMRELAD